MMQTSSLFLSVYLRDNLREDTRKVCISELEVIDWLLFFSNRFLTSGDVYYVGKPIESAVCYFNKQTSIFYGFIGAINGCFLTNQGACSILNIL